MPRSASPTLLVISQVYPPDPTSVGQHIHDAAAAVAQRGYRVVVYCANRGYNDPSKKFPSREVRDGVEIRRLPFSSLGKKTLMHRLLGQSMFLLQAVMRGLFTWRLAGILVSTSPPMASVAALMIRLVRRVKITFWVMDLNPDQLIEMGVIKETSLPARAFNLLNRAILRAADDVVALDRFMAERLIKKRDVRDKLTVMPPWPHVDHVESVEHADNPFRREHGLEGKFVVMYSGNHGKTTPVTTVLDAAVRMQDRPDLAFMFIGDGVGKRDVAETIQNHQTKNIFDLPYQPFDKLRFSLSAADVHLVTMDDNVVGVIHPCKVYGAMALGRPILLVGPQSCHVSDIIDGEHVGWRIAHGDVDAAVAVLDEMRAMPRAELEQMGDRAAKIVDEQFQRTAMIDKFTNIVLRGMPPAA